MAGMARSVPSGASAALQLLFFACSMHQLQQAAAQTCTANNGDCCMSLLKEDWLTEKEMLEPDRVAGSGGPGETLTDDLTTGVDYELFFTIALPDHSKDDATVDKLWGVPMQAGDDTVQADGDVPKMGLAFITECCKDEDNGLARSNGLYRAKNDWPRPGQPAGTDPEEQGMQAIPFLFFHSKRGLVLSVYDPARGLGTITARIGNGNGWGFGADPDGNRYNDRGDSMTTKKGAKYQDILAGKTVDVRIVVSGKYHALFAGDELLFEPYEMWTRDRDVTESARVKMGGVSVAQSWNPPKTLTQSIKNVRYFRRNHNEGVGLECTANVECPFLAANVATAANWRSVHAADVCGISKVPAGDDAASCNVEATRWFNAEKICTDVGARLCTRAELEAGALVDIARVDAAGDDLDEDLCEDTAAASPVWVADTCAISDPAGALGHQVVLSTGAAYGDGVLCIPEMIPLDETPKDTSGNAVVPLVRCCGSGTTSTTVTTTPTSTATSTPTTSTRTTTTSSISSTTTSATSTTTSVSTTTVSTTTTTVSSTTTSATTTTTTGTTFTKTSTTTTTTTTITTINTISSTTTTSTTRNASELGTACSVIQGLRDEGKPAEEMLSKGYEAVELYKCGYSHTEIQAGEEAFLGASTSTTDYICDLLKDNLKLDGSKMKDHDREKHCGSATGLVVAVVIVLLIFGAAGFMYYRKTKADAAGADRSTSDPDEAFVNDAAAVQRRPKPKRAPLDQRRRSTGSRPNSNGRLSSSWMQDATRATAETLLKGCRSGTFFVRPRNDTSYAFSVIIRNRVVHKLIKEAAPGEFTVDGKGGEWGSSLESVVAVVSLQMGTKYECAMYPLSAAAKQPETSARRPIRGVANAQPRTPARNDAGARANITTGEQTYEEIDDRFGDAAMQEKTYEEIDESGSINNTGVYETAFTLNAAYSTVQESAAAASASASQQSVQVRRISGYENTGARANHGPDVPVVTVNPHYHNDDATNDPTAVQNSTADPYASLLADASAYGTKDGAAVDFDYDDTDDSDVEI